jgi:hypothetical protein
MALFATVLWFYAVRRAFAGCAGAASGTLSRTGAHPFARSESMGGCDFDLTILNSKCFAQSPDAFSDFSLVHP